MQYILQNGAQITQQLIRKPVFYPCFYMRTMLSLIIHVVLYWVTSLTFVAQNVISALCLTIRGEARTDASFRDRFHLIHHKFQFRGKQTRLEMPACMVSKVPLDPIIGRRSHDSNGDAIFDTINMSLVSYIPPEFER